MASVLLRSEPVPIEVGDRVYWVKLDTRRSGPGGSSEGAVQYWAFLPPGIHPSTIRGNDRDNLIAQIEQTIREQAKN